MYNHAFCTQALIKNRPWSIGHQNSIISSSRDGKVNWYFTGNDESDFDYALKKAEEDETLLDQVEKEVTSISEATIERFKSVVWEDVSSIELLTHYEYYYSRYHDIGMIPGFLRTVDRAALYRLKNIFKGRNDVDGLISIVSASKKISAGREEEMEMLKIAKHWNEKSVEEKEISIDYIFNRFAWITLGYSNEKAKTQEDYRQKIKELSLLEPATKLVVIEREVEEAERAFQELRNSLDEDERTVIDIANRAVYLKDFYKFSVNKMQYFAEPLFEAIGKVSGKSRDFLLDLTLFEMRDLLSGRELDLAQIEKRRENHVIMVCDGKEIVLTGNDAEQFEELY
ncbi:MAG: hypothetical protein WC761_06340, partial [Candidatus Paceibacterota bacterium]